MTYKIRDIKVPARFYEDHLSRFCDLPAAPPATRYGNRYTLWYGLEVTIGNLYGDALYYANAVEPEGDPFLGSIVRSARRTVAALEKQLTEEQLDECQFAFAEWERDADLKDTPPEHMTFDPVGHYRDAWRR